MMKLMYDVYKKIIHREIKEISPEEYSKYLKDTEDFVKKMGEFIEGKK